MDSHGCGWVTQLLEEDHVPWSQNLWIMWNNLTNFTCFRITGFHDIILRISLVLISHLNVQVLGHNTTSPRRVARHHILEHLNLRERCCENLIFCILHLLLRVFHAYCTSEFLYVWLFLILWTEIDMIPVFGSCQNASILVTALLYVSSPSVFHLPQNCHFVYFISLHIILSSFMPDCIIFNLYFL